MTTHTTKDYYALLGLERDADDKAIKSAYRKLARKYHPDLNKGDARAEERFKEISEAFAVLSDPQKRARYDRGGHEAFGEGFDPFAGFDVRSAGVGDLSDIFEMFMGGGFGGGARRRRGGARMARRGRDLAHAVRLPFREAVRGTTLEFEIPRVGSGGARVSSKVKVRVPPGIRDGGQLRLRGKGDAGSGGGPAGDLFLEVRVDPHPSLRMEGSDLVADVEVGIATAALGGTVRVPTLDGSSEVTVPAGIRSGQKLRLRGQGVPGGGGRPDGDLLAVVRIVAPKRLDDDSRRLLEEFRSRNPDA